VIVAKCRMFGLKCRIKGWLGGNVLREKRIVLINRKGKAVKLFKNKAEAQKICPKNGICNSGEKFYHTQNGVSIRHSGYREAGMYLKWVWAKLKTEQGEIKRSLHIK
jgi:hypothetical protein